MTASDIAPSNPLLRPSPLPYQLPPFRQIEPEHYREALDAGMAEHRAEVDAIAGNPEPPTVENTLVALELSGRTLDRAARLFFAMSSSMSTQVLREIEQEFAPRFAAHLDSISLDPALFARIDALHDTRAELDLDPETAYLVQRYHTDFVLAGARLDAAGRARLTELNQEISTVSTTFQQNLMAAMEDGALHCDDVAELDGAAPDAVAAARAAAEARGRDGYLIPLVAPTQQPLLAVLAHREVRRRLFEASIDRASSPDHDNRPLAARIAELRAERAALLGFPTHADVVVADHAARTSAAVEDLLATLVGPAVANARAEARLLADYATRDGVELAPWDWAYYSAKVRAERYAVDAEALRPYFELDRVLHDGVFRAAELVYGITFRPRPELEGYHPDVRVWEVFDADGTPFALYLGDYFAREGKRGGAWMSTFVEQSALLEARPVVYNCLNVPKPADGPALLTFDEVKTLFHEFGHALHGLFSNVTYPRFSGTSVPRDVVEFPSQVNEMWALWPEILSGYARHVDTDEPLPAAVVASIEDAELWGQGFGTTEYLAATLLDWAWHRLAPGTAVEDPAAFEAAALAAAGVDLPLIPPRYRTGYFQHVFAGGYSAGYYSYVWAEVLDADTVEWFKENGGPARAAGDEFRAKLLSVGGSRDFMGAYRSYRGADPDIAPLLARRGLDRG